MESMTFSIEGWLTEGQAAILHDRAAALGPGDTVVEIGSYRGRSTVVLATAARAGVDIVAIDPHAGSDRGPRQLRGDPSDGQADHEAFVANLQRAAVADRVRYVRRFSTDALEEVAGPVALLYIDGAHRFRPAHGDLRQWGAKVPLGGTMLVHDSFNAIGVTLAQLVLLVPGRRFRFVARERSLSEYRREDLRGRDWVENAARQVAQLPYFARSLAIKVALATGRDGIARRLGHDGGPWPY
jgi:hypothetical protein